MKVITDSTGTAWIVVAEWYGEIRTVFGPCDIFTATQWKADNE